MVYRVLIGFIPMIFIALVLTGTIPLGGLIPTQEYRSSAVRAAEAKVDKEGKSERTGRGEMPSVGEAFRMHAEIRGDIDRMERAKRDGTFSEVSTSRPRPPGWKPKSSGWGAQED